MTGYKGREVLSDFVIPDATPVDGETRRPISSDWAYDHAADFGLHTEVIRKTADETVNNSNTPQNDDELLIAIAANETWLIRFYLLATSATGTPDIRLNVAIPSGASGWHWVSGFNNETTGRDISANMNNSLAGAITNMLAYTVLVTNGATAGNVVLKWSQITATAEDTKVLANSLLVATKIA